MAVLIYYMRCNAVLWRFLQAESSKLFVLLCAHARVISDALFFIAVRELLFKWSMGELGLCSLGWVMSVNVGSADVLQSTRKAQVPGLGPTREL